MSADHRFVISTTRENFDRDVIEKSSTVPVVVDFWAEWCGPCRRLGPILERLAEEYDGKFLLVKADTEALPEIASSFGVRSIPAVFGVREGAVVDGFVGLLPESAIRAFLERLMPSPADAKVAEARALEAADPGSAERAYRDALGLEPEHRPAKIGLALLLLARGQADEPRTLLADLERRGLLEPEAERLKAQLTIHDQSAGVGGVDDARAALASHPGDLDLQFKLAEALLAAGQYREALDLCLDLVERDRKGVGESARKTMVAVFQVLPADSEIVGEYRRRLSVAL